VLPCKSPETASIQCRYNQPVLLAAMLVIFLFVVLQQHVINTHKLLDLNKMF
jgi:hypothetical protein